jgi:hypothetical protein
MMKQVNEPPSAKQKESAKHVPHSLPVELANIREIRVDSLRSRVKKHKQHCATEPRHLCTEETPCSLAMLGSQPVGLVRQIDFIWRQGRESSRHKERRNCCDNNDDCHQQEKCRFRLSAVRNASACEVGSHHVGQLWVNVGPLHYAQHQLNEVENRWKSRIVHRGFFIQD